jgi:hypothetical protein
MYSKLFDEEGTACDWIFGFIEFVGNDWLIKERFDWRELLKYKLVSMFWQIVNYLI